jgi:hypothetical protein
VILTSGVAKAADKAGDLCDEGPLAKPYHPQDVVRRINLLREGRRTSLNFSIVVRVKQLFRAIREPFCHTDIWHR